MKIGILTFFESENYGTVLQAFSLQKYLQMQGHKVELVHLKREITGKSKYFSNNTIISYSLKERLKIKISNLWHNKDKKKKVMSFAEFRNKNLSIGRYYDSDEQLKNFEHYDLYLCGGDQIWNPYHKVFSYHYMWDFLPNNSKCASYSSSFGVSQINNDTMLEDMKKHLLRFSTITVREESGVEIIKSLGLTAHKVVDPVFLITSYWYEHIEALNYKKYCLIYALVDYPKEEDKIIQTIAKKHGWEIRILPENSHNHSTCYKKEFTAGPEEFINLIANAEFVFTNSFHGIAFSK